MRLARDGVLWVPDGDEHFFDRGARYERGLYREALKLCRGRVLAIDAGAHVGTWSMRLTKDFVEVHAFEPVPEHVECLKRNAGAMVHDMALSDRWGFLSMSRNSRNSGKAMVDDAGDVKVRSGPLDAFDFAPDLIKIDVEHHELHVLRGARETIAKHRPVLVIEVRDLAAVTALLPGYEIGFAHKMNHVFV